MVRFLEIQGPNVVKNSTAHDPKQHKVVKKEKKKTPKEKVSVHQRGRGPITGLSHVTKQ